jgi:hypothetical protein
MEYLVPIDFKILAQRLDEQDDLTPSTIDFQTLN